MRGGSSKILRYSSYFKLSSRYLEMWSNTVFRVLYNSSRTPNFSDQILFASKIQGIGMSPYLAWYSGYIVGTDSHEQRLQKAFLILFHASITVFRVVCMNCDPDFFHLEGKQKRFEKSGSRNIAVKSQWNETKKIFVSSCREVLEFWNPLFGT